MCRLHIDSFMDLAYNQNNLRQADDMRIAYRRITKALDSDIWRFFCYPDELNEDACRHKKIQEEYSRRRIKKGELKGKNEKGKF